MGWNKVVEPKRIALSRIKHCLQSSSNHYTLARPHKLHSQASSIALSEQTRQRYLCLLSSTNLPFGKWALTNHRPTNSLMELLFPELKAHYRQMHDSKSFLSTFLSILWNKAFYILFALLYKIWIRILIIKFLYKLIPTMLIIEFILLSEKFYFFFNLLF